MSVEVSAMLALALGRPLGARDIAWPAVFEIARKERCAPLAWLRSGSAIRDAAPADIVAAWRAEVMSAVSLADFWQELLEQTLSQLEGSGVDATVLKGLPLSHKLYGNGAARPSSDLDLHVPLPQRAAAHDALLAAGWRWRIGTAPHEAGYIKEHGERAAVLEVHSSLLDDCLVAHLPFRAPGRTRVAVGARAIAAHDDDQLPAYLATHLAKHAMPPMLWFVDFHELWERLDGEARSRAWDAARVARAERYLAWAIDRKADIAAAAGGDSSALQRLGFSQGARSDEHNAARVARLSSTRMDAVRVAAAWLLPGEARKDWREIRRVISHRAALIVRRAVGTRRSYVNLASGDVAVPAPQRSIVLGAGDFAAIVNELSPRDARLSIRATGTSMRPSLEPGTTIVLAPRSSRAIAVGDVVLAMTRRGSYVLHRVCALGDGWVQTQGDANSRADTPVPLEAVAAIAEAMLVDGAERPIPAARAIRLRRLVRTAVARSLRRGDARTPPTPSTSFPRRSVGVR